MGHDKITERIHLRKANPDDRDDILCWRNDEVTRSRSFTSHVITSEEHKVWFEYALGDPQRCLLIGTNEKGEKLGIVILKIDEEEAEININLAPEKRGRGLGVLMIKEALTTFFAEKGAMAIIAKIKQGNTASIRMFSKAGFLKVVSGLDMIIMKYIK